MDPRREFRGEDPPFEPRLRLPRDRGGAEHRPRSPGVPIVFGPEGVGLVGRSVRAGRPLQGRCVAWRAHPGIPARRDLSAAITEQPDGLRHSVTMDSGDPTSMLRRIRSLTVAALYRFVPQCLNGAARAPGAPGLYCARGSVGQREKL